MGQVTRRAVSPQPEPWQPLSLSREIAVSVSIGSSAGSQSSFADSISFSDGDDIHSTAGDYCMRLMEEFSADVSQQDGLCKAHIVDIITDKLLRNREIFSSATTTSPSMRRSESEGFLIPPTELFKLLSSSKHVYKTARPFPHIALDGLFDVGLLSECAAEFPASTRPLPAAGWGQRLQYPEQFRKRYLNLEALMGPACRSVISFLKSSVFVSFLEHLTGIQGLLTDPHNDGGGLHQTIAGGMLGVHTDFNYLKKIGLWRRVNLFLYLNAEPGWDRDTTATTTTRFTGGDLELWDAGAHSLVQSYAPMMNRLVIFTNSNVSLHGHPHALEVLEDMSRKSIALYFYSSRSGYDVDPAHFTTKFRETATGPAANRERT